MCYYELLASLQGNKRREHVADMGLLQNPSEVGNNAIERLAPHYYNCYG